MKPLSFSEEIKLRSNNLKKVEVNQQASSILSKEKQIKVAGNLAAILEERKRALGN